MTEQALTTVEFHGTTLFAVQRDGLALVPITPICNDVGLAPQRQRERIQRDPILSEGGTMVVLPSIGGMQETFCLRLDLVHGWLFTIDEARCKPEARARVLLYKREGYQALYRHFVPDAVQAAQEAPLPTKDLPWRERPLAERRVEIDTVAILLRADSPERALHYIDVELRIPGAMPADKKRQPGLFEDDRVRAREIMTFERGELNGETH